MSGEDGPPDRSGDGRGDAEDGSEAEEGSQPTDDVADERHDEAGEPTDEFGGAPSEERTDEFGETPSEEPTGSREGRDDTPGSAPPSGDGDTTPGAGSDEGRRPGPAEVYCYSCGTVIKEDAEICPECGVRQRAPPGAETGPPSGPGAGAPPGSGTGPPPREGPGAPRREGMTARRQRELERAANNDLLSTFVLSVFVPPLAYIEVGKPGYAAVNFLTANYLLLGLLIVPFHTYSTVDTARGRLRSEGVRGY